MEIRKRRPLFYGILKARLTTSAPKYLILMDGKNGTPIALYRGASDVLCPPNRGSNRKDSG